MRIYTKVTTNIANMATWLITQPEWNRELKNLSREGSRALLNHEKGEIIMDGPFAPDDKFEALKWTDLTYDTKIPRLAVKLASANAPSGSWMIFNDVSVAQVMADKEVAALTVIQNSYMEEIYADGEFTQKFLEHAEKQATV